MTTRNQAPTGAPCWADLWTSDVEGSRSFYSAVLGWESDEPNPEFGGYFMFTRNGAPVAGGMGDMGDMKADNRWKIYLDTDDIARTVIDAGAAGATIESPAMAVADLGIQVVMTDPTGAPLGAWQAGTFPGFTALGEHGAPSWFELHTGDYAGALDFYRSVFRWETDVVSDTDEFRYCTVRETGGEGQVAGIMDNAAFMADGETSAWALYWEVDDVDAAMSTVSARGGSVLDGAQDTPYGRLASVADPAGAPFRLRTSPA